MELFYWADNPITWCSKLSYFEQTLLSSSFSLGRYTRGLWTARQSGLVGKSSHIWLSPTRPKKWSRQRRLRLSRQSWHTPYFTFRDAIQHSCFSLRQTVQLICCQLRQSGHHAVRKPFRSVTLRPHFSASLPFLCCDFIIRFHILTCNSKYILDNAIFQALWLADPLEVELWLCSNKFTINSGVFHWS